MRKSGKVSIVVIIAVAFLFGIGAMSLFTEPSPGVVGAQFMDALSDLDAEKMAELSYAPGLTQEQVLEQWKYMTTVAAPEYTFSYNIRGEKKLTDDTAFVWMRFTKHAGMDGSYDERFELPMHKDKDGWKVDILSINRDFLPGLPR